jgi:hypothetical protein
VLIGGFCVLVQHAGKSMGIHSHEKVFLKKNEKKKKKKTFDLE